MRSNLVLVLLVAIFVGCSSGEDKAKVTELAKKPLGDSISIATFNIRMFTNGSRDDEELSYIVDVMDEYDLVAVQELRDTEVIQRTVAMLEAKTGWDYEAEVSPPVGRRVKERYAFVYPVGAVSVVVPGKLYDDIEDRFIREPYYVTFRAGDFDFTLVTIHVLYGKTRERRVEVDLLAEVYRAIQAEDAEEQDVILLGDLNFPPTDRSFDRLKELESMAYLLAPPIKTTISDASLYDNFWFQTDHVREYTGTHGVRMFDEQLFGNDDKAASLAVSDHRPVWAEFWILGPDDDGPRPIAWRSVSISRRQWF